VIQSSVHKRPTSRFRHPRLAAILFGLLLALALAEAGLRLAGPTLAHARPSLFSPRVPFPYDTAALDDLATGRTPVMLDPDLGWVNTPDFDQQGPTVYNRHNHAGMRADREYSPTPAPGVRRIAAYGDSFTYCDDVDLADCWTRRLEERLPNTEVLNFGVVAYGPDQAWLRYQRGGTAWQPCAVVIGHMLENINRVVNRFRPFYLPRDSRSVSKPRFLLDGDGLQLLPNPVRSVEQLKDPGWVEANLGPHDAWYFPGTFVANPFDRLELVRLVRTAAYRNSRDQAAVEWLPGTAERLYRPGNEAFEVLVRVLSGFAEQVRADGATPVVLVFPTSSEFRSLRDGGPRPYAALLDALRQRDVPTIDLGDALAEQLHASSPRDLAKNHLTPLGNSVVARALAAELPRLTAPTCGAG
jgi:hypothetical protein